MTTKVTAQDWEKVFNDDNAPVAVNTPDAASTCSASRILADMIEKQRQFIQGAEHIQRNKRVIDVMAAVKKLTDLLKHGEIFFNAVIAQASSESNTLIKCELIHHAVLLHRSVSLAKYGTKEKQATLNAYVIFRQKYNGLPNNFPAMFRVGSLSEPVLKAIRGTPIEYNFDFMRRLDPKSSDSRNLERIAAKLQGLHKKTIGTKAPQATVSEIRPTESQNNPMKDDFGPGFSRDAHAVAMSNPPLDQCTQCKTYFDPVKEGYSGKLKFKFCGKCAQEIRKNS
jgi:hypothetical protein